MCPTHGLLALSCLSAALRVHGVLGHLAPVHGCARSVRCVACAVSWVTWLPFWVCALRALLCLCGVLANWLLFTGVPTLCVMLRVQCPGPLGSCSPVCPLGVMCCVYGVLGPLAPVHRCAGSVCCAVCTVSWATWLLFTGVLVRCVVLRVRCPGPLSSCSPVCPLRFLCCIYGVLGPLAPVQQCAGSVCCAVCAVSWATWLLFTAVPARCVVLCVGRAGRRRGARARPSRRRLFVAGRGWVPSRRALVHPDGGCSVAGRGWVCCRARTRPSGGQLLLLGTCPPAVVRCVLCVLSGFAAAGGRCCLAPVRVPWLWPEACLPGVPCGPWWCAAPRLVRSLSVLWSVFPDAMVPFPTPGTRAPGFTARLRGGRGGRPRLGLIVPAAGPRRGRGAVFAPRCTHFGAPRWSCPWRVPLASVLGCMHCGNWRVWTRSLTRPVSRTVCRLTGDSASVPGLFCVDAHTSPCGLHDATSGSRACERVLVLPRRVGRAGLPVAFWWASPFLWPLSLSALLGPLRAGVAPFLFFCLHSFFSLLRFEV